MDIPINTDVYCADGVCGKSTYVILNPVTNNVTHVVVEERHFPYAEYLVPLEYVVETTPHKIQLRCTRRELQTLDPYIETEFIQTDVGEYAGDPYMLWPYVVPQSGILALKHERIPTGERAVHRGAHVEATDGHIGQVDEFLIDPESGHITHLVLREGHFWSPKEVTIPVSEIASIEEETVHLKLSKKSIKALPAVPIRRP